MATFDQASDEKGSPTFSHVECVQDLSDAVLNGVLEIAKTRFPPLILLELQQLGGALNNKPVEDMAYTAPKAPFYLKFVSPTLKTSLEELAPITMEAVNSLGPVYTREVSYNWMRGDQQPKVLAAFGAEKYKRLQELKRQFDPSNLFRQSKYPTLLRIRRLDCAVVSEVDFEKKRIEYWKDPVGIQSLESNHGRNKKKLCHTN